MRKEGGFNEDGGAGNEIQSDRKKLDREAERVKGLEELSITHVMTGSEQYLVGGTWEYMVHFPNVVLAYEAGDELDKINELRAGKTISFMVLVSDQYLEITANLLPLNEGDMKNEEPILNIEILEKKDFSGADVSNISDEEVLQACHRVLKEAQEAERG